ncbi:MAG: isoleucine--tRNA ligase [Candidatus Aenigmarchaeota archaeon]|nr:isoleucine--tRNA ligase [Candidatus Aenigmarchaeota archaeon]
MYDPQKIEEEITEKWKERNIPQKSREKVGKKKFYLIDGPPYATGHIHLGQALNKILKDFYVRFKRMNSHTVRYQPGYDTHGLPIENKVEKKLDLKSKRKIEEFGIEKFNEECKKFATEFVSAMSKEFENLGVWMDWENPYLTLKNDYIANSWYSFKRAFEKGLVFKDVYPLHVCPHCETPVSYYEIEYHDVTDLSIYVKFPVKGKDNEYLVIWTTTPWTIPANTGIMVHPDYEYSRVKTDKGVLIIATELVDKVMKKIGVKEYEIIETFKGSELEGLEYLHPFEDFVPVHKNIKHRVVTSPRYVTLESGTGLVHTAPGHGKEDYEVGKEKGLERLCPVKFDGTFTEEVKGYEGMYVKDANPLLIDELEKRGMLLGKENITHSYPFCWRCKTPLIQLTAPQWFIKVTKIRDKLIEENEKVNWHPEWAKSRFKDWLLNLEDWPITRKRYWGIPVPLWICDKCGKMKVIGSKEELGKELKDLHRPYIDEITFDCECGGKMKRIPDVFDVWYDSGVCSWVSLGYPEKKELFEKLWPPDLNIEGSDQFRGWWNSQMILSVITFDKKPFENIITHGLILDVKGIKMSKSLGNVITPKEVIEKYGRDALRMYFLSSEPGDNFHFNMEDVKEIYKDLNILWNVYNFYKNYCKKVDEEPPLETEDRWILSRINTIIKEVTEYNDRYQGYKSTQIIRNFFVNDLSRTYIKLIRDRTWPTYEGEDKKAAFYALGKVMESLTKLLAPICPYISDTIYQGLDLGESVHLDDWPKPNEKMIDHELESKFRIIEKIVEASNSMRQKENVGLRYPIKRMMISGPEEVKEAVNDLKEVLKKMANVKKIEFTDMSIEYEIKLNYAVAGPKYGKDVRNIEEELKIRSPVEIVNELNEKGGIKIGNRNMVREDFVIKVKTDEGIGFTVDRVSGVVNLDFEETEDIFEERLIREVIRGIQQARKENELKVDQKIGIEVETDDETRKIINKYAEVLEKEAGIKEITFTELESGRISKYKNKTIKFKLEVS